MAHGLLITLHSNFQGKAMFKLFNKFLGVIAVIALGVGAANAMPTNTDFETGSINPWYQDNNFTGPVDWTVTGTAINGNWSAYNEGNKRLRQDFAGIDTDNILSITFNLLTDGHAVNAYNFFYSDGSAPQGSYFGTEGIVQLVDVTANLAAGKTLVGFGIYGNTGGSTTFDDFTITVREQDVPAPAALGLLGMGLIGLGGLARRRR
jgi:hypothetical protein